MVACAHLLELEVFLCVLGCRGQHVLQCLTQVIFPIVNLQETGGHMNGLCLCARITSSCCQGPCMFIEYLQPLNKTKKLVFWEGKRSPVFFCVLQLVN